MKEHNRDKQCGLKHVKLENDTDFLRIIKSFNNLPYKIKFIHLLETEHVL